MNIRVQLLDSVSGELLLDSNGRKTTGRSASETRYNISDQVSSVRYWNDAYHAFRQWASLLGTQIQAVNTSQG